MLRAPAVIGIKQFTNWKEAGSVEATLYGLGNNTGNMMFTQSLLSILRGAKWGSFGLSDPELEGRDGLVIACANWINDFEDLGWLADRLEKTSLPVILVGVGAQSSLTMEMPNVRPGTLRLLSIAADRSNSISARGNFTCDVLNKLGYKNVVPTGCPSLLLSGRAGPSISIPTTVEHETTCIHATRHGVQPPQKFEATLYQLAFQNNMDIILQSETPDIYCSLSQTAPDGKNDKFSDILLKTYSSTELQSVSYYLKRHGRTFSNYYDWFTYMKTKKFCFGTRVHGTIASLIAGTAATLIVHDSRTLEMAQSMSIPFIFKDEYEKMNKANLEDMVRPDAIKEFMMSYMKYYQNFKLFFENNKTSLLY